MTSFLSELYPTNLGPAKVDSGFNETDVTLLDLVVRLVDEWVLWNAPQCRMPKTCL